MTIQHLPLAAPLLGNFVWAVVMLFAQGEAAPTAGVGIGGLGDLVQPGFLAWFAWHVTTHTLPKQSKDFSAAVAAERAAFLAALEERDKAADGRLALFIGELRADRASHALVAQSNHNLSVSISELSAKVKSRPQD